MALNNFKCNHLTQLYFKGLKAHRSDFRSLSIQSTEEVSCECYPVSSSNNNNCMKIMPIIVDNG